MFDTKSDTKNIEMVEGDYGLILPIILRNEEITNDDKFDIKIFKNINEEPIIFQTYSNIENSTIDFKLSKTESEKLKVGSYFYDLDWYQDENFLGNLIAKKSFKVKEKAGAVNGNRN